MAESMVRREFELTREEAEKLARVAAERGCSEDEVVRAAIETFEDDDDRYEWIGSLRVSKLRKLTDEEQQRLDANMRWLAAQPYAGLSEAIIEERESGY